MGLYCPLSPITGTATCPNCKEDERIKEMEFGCDCNEKEGEYFKKKTTVLAAYLEHFRSRRIHRDSVKHEIVGNQTLVDWLVVSGGIHFELDSREGVKIEEKQAGSERGWMGGGRDRKRKKTGNMRAGDTTRQAGTEQLTC